MDHEQPGLHGAGGWRGDVKKGDKRVVRVTAEDIIKRLGLAGMVRQSTDVVRGRPRHHYEWTVVGDDILRRHEAEVKEMLQDAGVDV